MSAAQVAAMFPNLKPGFGITSPVTPSYNCIGWAADDEHNFWWPGPKAYWPQPHDSIPSVALFEAAFLGLGYALSNLDDSLDPVVEKVAIYISPITGLVTHMARQLPDGRWTSKLGKAYDITHVTTTCLDGALYGMYSHCLGRMRSGQVAL